MQEDKWRGICETVTKQGESLNGVRTKLAERWDRMAPGRTNQRDAGDEVRAAAKSSCDENPAAEPHKQTDP